MNLANLFGCVDELTLGGQEFDLSKANLPPCPDCFVLDAKAVHVLPKVQDIIQPDRGLLLPLNCKSLSSKSAPGCFQAWRTPVVTNV